MKITKITIGRLYNLGSYEHVRYELTAEVENGSVATALVGLEKILAGLSPKTATKTQAELDRQFYQIEAMKKMLAEKGEGEFRSHYGHSFVGTPAEYIQRWEDQHTAQVEERKAWEQRCAKARDLLDDLGGAAVFKDAKLEWENDYD